MDARSDLEVGFKPILFSQLFDDPRVLHALSQLSGDHRAQLSLGGGEAVGTGMADEGEDAGQIGLRGRGSGTVNGATSRVRQAADRQPGADARRSP